MTSAQPGSRMAVVRLLIACAAIDVVLIAINIVGAPSFLSLDEERNFPTWYSSAKLLGVALAALWCYRLEPAERRTGAGALVWPALSGIFVLLSIDETSTAHERLAALLMQSDTGHALRTRLLGGDATKDAYIWPVLFAPVIVALIYFLATSLYARLRHDRRNLILGLAGCAAFLLAVVLEGPAVYSSPPIEAWGAAEIARYTLMTLIEESAEVFGATSMLAALLLHASAARPSASRH